MTTYRYDVLVLLQTEHDIIVTAWKQLRDGVTVHLMPHLHMTEILAKHVMSHLNIVVLVHRILDRLQGRSSGSLGAGDTGGGHRLHLGEGGDYHVTTLEVALGEILAFLKVTFILGYY